MAIQTGENEQGLRKILDMTRMISLILLTLHCYYYCYAAFKQWGLTAIISDRLLMNITHTGLFSSFGKSKLIALTFLFISVLGAKGRKDEKVSYKTAFAYILTGLVIYFFSSFTLSAKLSAPTLSMLYIGVTGVGYILILTGGSLLSRVIQLKLNRGDVFNTENETFPQEERLLQNEYSINLPAQYKLKGKVRKSWINIINPFRGLLVLGSPGSGKTYFVIQHVIIQHIQKGFTLFIYDFKFDDLTRIAYTAYLTYQYRYHLPPKFYVINFDDLSRSHRCNPLDPSTMLDITDAAEAARTILLGLNREWIKRQGDFFVESAVNFLTAIIWYLRKYHEGEFCTLPHVIELMQTDYDELFSVLRMEKEIEVLIHPFITAYLSDVMEQLEGQMAAAKLALARLSSPSLYYVLSGNDFTLDINNPQAPKIVCMGNNPQKIGIYGAVLSLYINQLIKHVNRKGGVKSSLVFDEFPTIYLNNIDHLIATARSNQVATTLGMQDFSQLRKDYGREQADVIMNIAGNVISGQVSGDTAKQLSERFGKILQDRESVSINSTDTSISHSRQLESAIPPSTIATLSSGTFVGVVADNPDQRIKLKTFHASIKTDRHNQISGKSASEIPVIRKLDSIMMQRNYLQIKQDIEGLIHAEMEHIVNDPELAHLLIRKDES